MPRHEPSADDLAFRRGFEALQVAPAAFDHPAHVRLAYVYLCEAGSVDEATRRMKEALLAFLAHLGIGEGKYHETMTRAWVMGVDHFMTRAGVTYASAASFMSTNPELLDSRIMLTHYSAELLFSADARRAFVQPDLQSIPPS